MANYRRTGFDFFWEGARQHVMRGVWLWLLIVLAPPVMGISLSFYFSGGGWLIVPGFITLWLLVLAMLAVQYFYPLFWQQTEPSLGLIVRNGFLLVARHPLYSLLMFLFQILLIVLSIVLVAPIVLILPGLLILSHNYALIGLLQEMNLAPPPPEMSGT
jgi:protein-S-isoprenylcysteine O-methyltransferase Ste14